MLAQQTTPNYYTLAEYLALEEQAEYKNEYYQGQIRAMAGASANHNRLVSNLHANLYHALEAKSCEVFVNDLRVWVEQKDLGAYPDVMVVCGGLEFLEGRTDTVINPKIIIEVLSESTAIYDKGDKFYAYWTLDTFEEYVLVDQYQIRVEYFRRVDEKIWELRVFTKLDDYLTLQSIDVALPLDRIYRNVDWDEK